MMRCDVMRCDAMRCDATRHDAMRCDAMRNGIRMGSTAKTPVCRQLRFRTWISKPDGSCRRPIKDSKDRRNSRLPWVLSFLSYLCLSPWVPGSAAWPQGGQKRSCGTFRIPGRGSQVWPQGGRKHSRGRIRRIQVPEAKNARDCSHSQSGWGRGGEGEKGQIPGPAPNTTRG